jgi:acyl-CoA thioesterase
MNFLDLLSGHWDHEALCVTIPESWAQGRTAYGGLTAAICAEACRLTADNLPPLRSAQISFVGPAAGESVTKAAILRRGKNTTFVGADLHAEAGLATRGSFIYGKSRESGLSFADYPIPEVAPLDEAEPATFTKMHPAFLSNFDVRVGGGGMPFMGKGPGRMDWWVRHRDPEAWGTETGLLALSDVTPPAIAPLVSGPAPVSSVTWQHDFLTDDLSTEEGWYLLSTVAEAGASGWSGQTMGVWASDGRPICAGRQTVVIFD